MSASVIISFLTAVIVATISASLVTKRVHEQKLREEINTERKKLYIDLIESLQKMLDDEWNEEIEGSGIVEKMKELQAKTVYYASAKVLTSLGDVMQHIFRPKEKYSDAQNTIRTKKLFAELIVSIRKDLGHYGLMDTPSWLDILRLNTTDITDYVDAEYKRDRGEKTVPTLTVEGKRVK